MRNKGSPKKDTQIMKIGIILSILTLISLCCIPILSTKCRIQQNEIVENGKTVHETETVPVMSTLPEEKTERQDEEETDISSETTSSTEIPDEDIPRSDMPKETINLSLETQSEETVSPVVPVHTHQYTTITEYATCTNPEYTTYKCSCGHNYTETTAKAMGHSYKKYVVEPTVTSKGYDEFVCTRCAYSYQTNYVGVVATHTHDFQLIHSVAATCTESGYEEHVCSCGETKIKTTNEATGHALQTIESDKPACAITQIVSKCQNCDYEEVEEVEPQVSHTFPVTTIGESEENFIGEEQPEYDGTETISCELCGAIAPMYMTGAQQHHNMGEWKDSGPHIHSRTCTDPGCNYIEAERHVHTIAYKKNPTCTRGTITAWHCLFCKRNNMVVEQRNALGHDFIYAATVPPKGEELGYDLMKCSRCNETTKQNFVSLVSHDCKYVEGEIPPTCVSSGIKTKTCTICKKVTRVSSIPALGHDYRHMIKNPTCQEPGGKIESCVRCGDFYFTERIEIVPHNYILVGSEIATTGWAGYEEYVCSFCNTTYTKELPKLKSSEYPKGYRDDTCTIIIYKEWYHNAYVYAAHVTFTDYDRLWVECGKGKYNSGGETTSAAAKRVGAILAINGDYAVPGNGAGGYAIARKGKVCNDKKTYAEGVYNHHTGMLLYGQSKGIGGVMLSELVANKKVTDTFQFGPCMLLDGKVLGDPSSTSRAQRTFIGTNGRPGDIWLCVSDGRYNDGSSAGLNGYQCGAYLASKGCTLGVPLDGGGSTTMYFNGSVLNAAKNGQRAVVDFVMFK